MKKTVFKGAGVAIATPLNSDGINYAELEKMLEFQIANHTDAIIIAGTTGEAATMTEEEHRQVIKFAVDKVNGRIPVIAGTGSNCTQRAIALSRYAASVGVDALLVVTPYYNKCTQSGLIAHFTTIADAVNVPIILYNVPSRTGVNILPETYAKLSTHPNIVAIKEANGDLSAILKTRALCDLDIYSGNDDQIVPILSLGGKGVISVLSNVAPQAVHDMCAAYFAGQTEKAADLQIKWAKLISALFIEVNPIPVKHALNLMGFAAGHLRLPLTEISPEHHQLLSTLLKQYNLIK